MNRHPSVRISSDSGSTLRPLRSSTTSAGGDSTSPIISAADSVVEISNIRRIVNSTAPVAASASSASSVNEVACVNGSTCTIHGTATR